MGVSRLSIEPNGKTGELAFIISDQWQRQGLGTKTVEFTLEIAKEMHVETVYAIILPDNHKALNLTKKLGFKLEYLNDGIVKATLNLKDETPNEKYHKPKQTTKTTLLQTKKKQRKIALKK